MSIIYPISIRNSRLQVAMNGWDGGPGNAKIQLGTSGMAVVLSTVSLLKPSGSIANGILTFLGTPLTDPLAANSGTAAAAQIVDSNNVVWASGLTVGLAGSGANVIISLVNITAGSIVIFQSGTITGN